MKTFQLYRSILIICTFVLGSQVLKAQESDTLAHPFWRNWQIELHSGPMFFYGEGNDSKVTPSPRDWRLGYGVSLTKTLNNHWAFRGTVFNGALAGHNKELDSRFEADVITGALQATYNISSLIQKPGYLYEYKMYGIAGLGMSNWESKRYTYKGIDVIEANGLGTGKGIGGKTFESNLNLGIGMNINLADNIHLIMETSFFGTMNDELDAYSPSGNIPDVYQYSSLGLGYSFNFKTKKSSRAKPSDNSGSWKKLRMQKALSQGTSGGNDTLSEIVTDNIKANEANAQKVDVVCWTPNEVKSGEKFTLHLEVLKGILTGKAEIKIILPDRFYAEEQEVPGAIFIPIDKNLTIYYKSLPDGSRIPIQIEINSDRAIPGNYAIYLMGKITDSKGQIYKFSTITSFRQSGESISTNR
ncbi:MAG: hypothetical protein Q7J34_07345 [Bacteroidales bacterium]|nr:hypothetical protein [Bacteroidales bacterium]